MPKYDFNCNQCKKEFSLELSIKERNNGYCPYCNSNEIERVYKNISIVKPVAGSNRFT